MLASTLFTERIWPKVDASGSENACWPWLGAKTQRGHGMISWAGQQTYVHRLVYARHVGLIPDGFDVHHTCENPPCCNPAHLVAVSHSENMRLSGARMARWGNQNRRVQPVSSSNRQCQNPLTNHPPDWSTDGHHCPALVVEGSTDDHQLAGAPIPEPRPQRRLGAKERLLQGNHGEGTLSPREQTRGPHLPSLRRDANHELIGSAPAAKKVKHPNHRNVIARREAWPAPGPVCRCEHGPRAHGPGGCIGVYEDVRGDCECAGFEARS